MRFRDTGHASLRQRAARRLAEIEQEIRDIKRLFPGLIATSSRYRSRRLEHRHHAGQAGRGRRSGRHVIH